MSGRGRLPDALRSSAVPRWSHRDPVEPGNPFPRDDPRHRIWAIATSQALETLARIDRDLDEAARPRSATERYEERVVALASSRFDVWAGRGISVVETAAALRDYEEWLDAYVTRWVSYLEETCPGLDVTDELRAILTGRATYWTERARRGVADAG